MLISNDFPFVYNNGNFIWLNEITQSLINTNTNQKVVFKKSELANKEFTFPGGGGGTLPKLTHTLPLCNQ